MKKIEIVLLLSLFFSILLRAYDIWVSRLIGPLTLVLIFSVLLILFYLVFTIHLLCNIQLSNFFKIASYHNISSLRAIGLICLASGLSSLLIGVLFCWMRWNGAFMYLSESILVLSVVGVAAFKRRKIINEPTFYNNVLVRVTIGISIGVTHLFIVFSAMS